MEFKTLRESVLEANLSLVTEGLVSGTFGNVSGIDRSAGVVAIKPSGVPYARLRAVDIVVLDLASGEVRSGDMRPSSDTKTHLVLYRAWPTIGGVCHTHSFHATAWAQARRPIPCYGTTHADVLAGEIPIAPILTEEQIAADYETATGHQILSALAGRSPDEVHMILLAGHAPFTWAKTPAGAVAESASLEVIARLALLTERIAPAAEVLPRALLAKHWERKHGPGAYYGQSK